MVEAKNITRAYDGLQVLQSVSLKVETEEVVSIVGPSGAGKSTMLHILGSIDKPDSGEVYINGQRIDTLTAGQMADFRNRHIGFIFQFHHLLPEFDALENVQMPALIAGTSRSESEARAKELLSMLGLAKRLRHKPNELSGGEQQRVAVARALMNKPDVVLADEPSGNLDTQSAEALHKLFFDLRKELGQTFIIVTHNMELAEQADRKLVMVDGQIQSRETTFN